MPTARSAPRAARAAREVGESRRRDGGLGDDRVLVPRRRRRELGVVEDLERLRRLERETGQLFDGLGPALQTELDVVGEGEHAGRPGDRLEESRAGLKRS